MDLYSELILDHYQNPRNTGSLAGFTHSASEVNPFCGDGIYVQLRTMNNELRTLRYKATGCAISIASASILSENLPGKGTDQILKMSSADVLRLLGIKLTMTRVQCALLPLMAIKKALQR